jgi:hypothetical protein
MKAEASDEHETIIPRIILLCGRQVTVRFQLLVRLEGRSKRGGYAIKWYTVNCYYHVHHLKTNCLCFLITAASS